MSKYIINNIEYSMEDIKNNKELENNLLKQMKKEYYKKTCRETARKWRAENREKVNEYSREYQRRRYNEEEQYKLNKLEKMKTYLNKKKLSI
jgi:hypothetical protein